MLGPGEYRASRPGLHPPKADSQLVVQHRQTALAAVGAAHRRADLAGERRADRAVEAEREGVAQHLQPPQTLPAGLGDGMLPERAADAAADRGGLAEEQIGRDTV